MRFFGKKSKMALGNTLRKVPNDDAIPLVGARDVTFPFAKNYLCMSLLFVGLNSKER